MSVVFRADRHEAMMAVAENVACLATCYRRAVGCVLVSARKEVLATGYNGPSRGTPHCLDGGVGDGGEGELCPGALDDRHEGLCRAVHAEANALVQLRDPWLPLIAYVTAAPCARCTRMLANTSLVAVIYGEASPKHPEAAQEWRWSGRLWLQFKQEAIPAWDQLLIMQKALGLSD